MLHEKRLEALTSADIQYLVDNRVAEGRNLEYKSELPSNDDRSVKEFLADVTSFANSSGGLILFGIEEEAGSASGIPGVEVLNPDSEILRLENLMRTGVEPRLPGMEIRILSIDGKSILAIRILRSWVHPHAVVARKHWRFYARNSVGKYPLDVGELRTSFELSANSQQRISRFRMERLATISSNTGPIPLAGNAFIALHIFPLSALDPANQIDLNVASERQGDNILRPLGTTSWDTRYCFDGFLSHRQVETSSDGTLSYALLFRNGALEVVDSHFLSFSIRARNRKQIPSVSFEQKILDGLPEWVGLLRAGGATLPMVIMLSLLGVDGYSLGVDDRFRHFETREINQRDLILPEAFWEDESQSFASVLRPVFDVVWNAAGYAGSLNYDESGQWVGQ